MKMSITENYTTKKPLAVNVVGACAVLLNTPASTFRPDVTFIKVDEKPSL